MEERVQAAEALATESQTAEDWSAVAAQAKSVLLIVSTVTSRF